MSGTSSRDSVDPVSFLREARDAIGPQPVMNPWIVIPITLDTIQYKASPASKLKVKNPNMIGNIHSIILCVDSCCWDVAGVDDIFCITHIEPPTRIGSRNGTGFSADVLARSKPMNVLSSGTATCA